MKVFETAKLSLTDLLETHQSKWSQWVEKIFVGIILLATIFFMLETTELSQQWINFFHGLNIFFMIIFSLEYILRVSIQRNKIRYVFSWLSLIDLAVISSFYLFFINLSFLRIFRVFRVLLVLKVVSHSHLMRSFFGAFRYYKQEIKIFVTSFALVLIMSSSALYFLEHNINEHFKSIPDALWWAVVTVSTVGYGDMVPITILGRIVSSVVMIMGLITIAILTALITKVFIDHFFGKRMHECTVCHFPRHDYDAKFCKNCGTQLDIQEIEKDSKQFNHIHY